MGDEDGPGVNAVDAVIEDMSAVTKHQRVAMEC